MVDKVPIGIQGMNSLHEGGLIPRGTTTLLYGPPKTGKTLISWHFLYSGLEAGESGILINTESPWKNIAESSKDFGFNFETFFNEGKLFVIDILPSKPKKLSFPNHFSVSVNDITGLILKLSLILQKVKSNVRVVMDSLSYLILFNDEKRILRMLYTYNMRMKAAKGTSMICYHEGSAATKSENMIKALCDNIIHITGDELEVEALASEIFKKRWKYKVTKEGVVIKWLASYLARKKVLKVF